MRHEQQGYFLFLGDFFIANYDWQKRMPFFKVNSYSVMDEKVKGLLTRLPEVIRAVKDPNIILVMSGMNNAIEYDYTFLDNLRRIVITLTNRYPNSEVIVNSLPLARIPMVVDNAIHHLNQGIKKMASETGSCYLDNFDILAQKDSPIFEKDGLHLTADTYEKWARSILEYVSFLFEDN